LYDRDAESTAAIDDVATRRGVVKFVGNGEIHSNNLHSRPAVRPDEHVKKNRPNFCRTSFFLKMNAQQFPRKKAAKNLGFF
jgi:hypothetical protein